MTTQEIPVIFYLEQDRKISELKAECSRRIQTFNGKYYDDLQWMRKSQNLQDIKNNYIALLIQGQAQNVVISSELSIEYQNAIQILARKDRYIQRCNQLEQEILAIKDLSILLNFDITSDAIWSQVENIT